MATAEDKHRADERRRKWHQAQEDAMGQAAYQDGMRRAAETKGRLARPQLPATREQLAIVARHLEKVFKNTLNPKEEKREVETERAVTLCDLMYKDGMITFDQYAAALDVKELYWKTEGVSRGVPSYGDFDPGSPIWERMPTSDRQMSDRDKFYLAAFAAFAVPTNEFDGTGKVKWVVNEELMTWGILAVAHEHKNVTQAAIGNALSPYKGRAQVNAAGGQTIFQLLDRWVLHFRYRQR